MIGDAPKMTSPGSPSRGTDRDSRRVISPRLARPSNALYTSHASNLGSGWKKKSLATGLLEHTRLASRDPSVRQCSGAHRTVSRTRISGPAGCSVHLSPVWMVDLLSHVRRPSHVPTKTGWRTRKWHSCNIACKKEMYSNRPVRGGRHLAAAAAAAGL